MNRESTSPRHRLWKDFLAGWSVFLIALPISVGIAQGFSVSPYAGLIAGIVGGIVVGLLSGSQTSISGPAAGLSVIILSEIALLKSFDTFLLALLVAGLLQVAFGLLRLGSVSYFFPSSIIKGLIAAVGLILILKQIPHLLGHDTNPIGEMSFWQPDRQNTFSEYLQIAGDTQLGAMLIAAVSLLILFLWERAGAGKWRVLPAPIVVVFTGALLALWLRQFEGRWGVDSSHFFDLGGGTEDEPFFQLPRWSAWNNPAVYLAGLVIAVVASLETLLNLDAIDRLDPQQRNSPPSRELVAQGIGNALCGLIGGLPITSRIVHSDVSVINGGQSKWAAVFHGLLFLICITFLPRYLNAIPLSCVAAILLHVGLKMARPGLFLEMWREGRYQFIPFILTVLAIIFSEQLVGAVFGLVVGIGFILNSNLRQPLKRIVEQHTNGELIRIELANQVSFLNRGAIEKTLHETPAGTHLLIDASSSDFIDPDIVGLIREFKEKSAAHKGVVVSLRGFKDTYSLNDEISFMDYATRELQADLAPAEVLRLLREGNQRFHAGTTLFRNYASQLETADQGQFPFAAVLSCIDSRAPVETILDLGLGDIFSVRIAGNVVGPKVLGSLEYACAVAGSKLILVLGHTKCGAVTAAVNFTCSGENAEEVTGCKHLQAIIERVSTSIDRDRCALLSKISPAERASFVEGVARANVLHSIELIMSDSPILNRLASEGKIAIVGAMYNVASGEVEFYVDQAVGLKADRRPQPKR